MSSYNVKLHIENYRDLETVEKARKLVEKYPGVSDRWVARLQWHAWLAVEPEFKDGYESLLEALGKAGVRAKLADPVRLVFSTPATDAEAVKKVFTDRKRYHRPRLDAARGKLEVYVSSDRLDPDEIGKMLRTGGVEAKLASHRWLEMHVEGIDCAECVEDLEKMAGRVPGVLIARLSMKGRLQVLTSTAQPILTEARKKIREHVEGYGFSVHSRIQ